MDVEEILEHDVERVKDLVERHEPDVEELITKENRSKGREDLLTWLEEKKRYIELLEDEERIQNLLSHIEFAYRTASVSEETYQKAKSANKELLRE